MHRIGGSEVIVRKFEYPQDSRMEVEGELLAWTVRKRGEWTWIHGRL
jgi:hypothetical protein